MNKKIIAFFVVILIIFIIVTVWLVLKLNNNSAQSEYSAVYLSNGEIYFGKLSWFPSPHLSDVFFIQRVADEENPSLSLQPFNSVIWGPENEINLNSKEIIFWTNLRPDSQVVQIIETTKKSATTQPAVNN
jgi:hypothetical protein